MRFFLGGKSGDPDEARGLSGPGCAFVALVSSTSHVAQNILMRSAAMFENVSAVAI